MVQNGISPRPPSLASNGFAKRASKIKARKKNTKWNLVIEACPILVQVQSYSTQVFMKRSLHSKLNLLNQVKNIEVLQNQGRQKENREYHSKDRMSKILHGMALIG